MTKNKLTPRRGGGFLQVVFDQPYAILFLAPVFWGGNVVAGKLAVGEVDPDILLLGRWVGACILLLTIGVPQLRRDWQKIRAGWPILALYGMVGFATFNMLTYQASHFTAGVNIAIEQAAIPALVMLGNFLFFRVRAPLLQVLGLIISFIGVVIVATQGEPVRILALDINLGDALILLACAIYAAYSLALRWRPGIEWLSYLLVTSIFALIASLAFAILLRGGASEVAAAAQQTTPKGWLIIAYTMIFPSILAQMFYVRGVELIGANRASIFINLIPILGTVLTVLILGETLSGYHFLAGIIVICGIILSEVAVRRPLPVRQPASGPVDR